MKNDKPYVTPYCDGREKADQVRDMFDNIAPDYDRLNRAMSFGMDKIWRKKAVQCVARSGARDIVDIATGTADFAISIVRAIPDSHVTGLDISQNMINVGRNKISRLGLSDRITLKAGNCLDNPLAPACADAVTVAFGVRNFSDILAGYRAMLRMLRPGGIICVLELSTPVNAFVRPFYRLYTSGLIPLMGRIVSGDRRAYSYLPESIAAVPQADEMTNLMTQAGFCNASFRRLSLGVCTLYTAYSPSTHEKDL